MHRRRAIVLFALAALSWVPSTFAQERHSGTGEEAVEGTVVTGSSTAGDSLAVTGFDLKILATGLLVIFALGLVVRGVARSSSGTSPALDSPSEDDHRAGTPNYFPAGSRGQTRS